MAMSDPKICDWSDVGTAATLDPNANHLMRKKMSPEQKAIVTKTWQSLALVADTAVRYFYDKLFEIDPTTRPLFRTANMAEQRQKIIAALTMVVQGLDRLETLVPRLEALGRRHAQYGVGDDHYNSVGVALLWMLENMLGPEWTPAAEAAWTDAYTVLADVMRGAVRDARPALSQATGRR
jgi:hemoglobin-like flavoprotein